MTSIFLLPDVTDANDLFHEMVRWEHRDELSAPAPTLYAGKERMTVGPYVLIKRSVDHPNVPSVQSMAVVPTPFLIDTIKDRFIVVNRDQIHFEIIVRPDGLCRVIASHGQILGSRALTDRLQVETLPEFVLRHTESEG